MSDPVFSRPWWRALGFRAFGALARPRKHRWAPLPRRPVRILVLLPVLRGDYLVATPLLNALRKARPHAELTVLVTRASHDIAMVDPVVDRVLLYEKLPWWPRSVWQLLRLRPEIVVLPKGHPAFTESLMILLSRAKYRVGLSHPHHDSLLTHPVQHDWENEHRTEAFSRLMQPFGVDPTSVKRIMHIGVDPNAEEWAKGIVDLDEDIHPRLSVNISAGNPTRVWPAQRWRELIEKLLNSYPQGHIHLLAAPADQPLAGEIAETNQRCTAHWTHTVLEAAALVARCDILVTSDTGIVHVSTARGVPQVVLYNGDHEVYTRFAPQSVKNRALLAPKGRSVASHDVDTVLGEVQSLLEEVEGRG
jgi:ADP-heptose:LPS heptosyltransferase